MFNLLLLLCLSQNTAAKLSWLCWPFEVRFVWEFNKLLLQNIIQMWEKSPFFNYLFIWGDSGLENSEKVSGSNPRYDPRYWVYVQQQQAQSRYCKITYLSSRLIAFVTAGAVKYGPTYSMWIGDLAAWWKHVKEKPALILWQCVTFQTVQ